jgi:hypothetical protein
VSDDNHESVDAGLMRRENDVLEDRFTAQMHQGFGEPMRRFPQAGPFACREDQALIGFADELSR